MTWEVSEEVFNLYKQERYDLSFKDLTKDDIVEIRKLSKEKRSNYGNAPIGRKIFNLITEQEPNIIFKLAEYENKDIDAFLYIPFPEAGRAYIVLNSSRPLISQIFAAAHEYYHYLKDFQKIQKESQICFLEHLETVSEQKASRFAAELLLPVDALREDIERSMLTFNVSDAKKLSHVEWSAICIILVKKYELPLKAVMFRIAEEGFIEKKSYKKIIDDYDFIKGAMNNIKIESNKSFKSLMSPQNDEIPLKQLYKSVFDVYNCGFATGEEIIKDSSRLGLNKDLVADRIAEDEAEYTCGEKDDFS